MLNQIFSTGTGGGNGPVDYCLAEIVKSIGRDGQPLKDEHGAFIYKTRIPTPVLVKGDSEITRSLINVCPHKYKYTSGVLAFADTDMDSKAPDMEKLREVIDDFEKTFFAGLNEQVNFMWTMHCHEGNVELHYVIPRLHLPTGKSINGFPPGYEKLSDTWRDYWNHKEGWASPADPERKRIIVSEPSYETKLSLQDYKNKLVQPEVDERKLIGDFLWDRVGNGEITDRATIESSLSAIGWTVHRSGYSRKSQRHTLTIRPLAEGKPDPDHKGIKFAGSMFDPKWTFTHDRSAALKQKLGLSESENRRDNEAGLSSFSASPREDYQEIRKRLDSYISKRAAANRIKYSTGDFGYPGVSGVDEQPNSTDFESGLSEFEQSNDGNHQEDTKATVPRPGVNLQQDAGYQQDNSERANEDRTSCEENKRSVSENPEVAISDDLGGSDWTSSFDAWFRSTSSTLVTLGRENNGRRLPERNEIRIPKRGGMAAMPNSYEANSTLQSGEINDYSTSRYNSIRSSRSDFPTYGRLSDLLKGKRNDMVNGARFGPGSHRGSFLLGNESQIRPSRDQLPLNLSALRALGFSRKGGLNEPFRSGFARFFDQASGAIQSAFSSAKSASRSARIVGKWFSDTAPIIARWGGGLKRTYRTIQDGIATLKRFRDRSRQNTVWLSEATRVTTEQHRQIGAISSKINQLTERLRLGNDNEIEAFKSEINLYKYASSKGYDLIKNESSENFYVMQSVDGDKIVVMTASDGHGVYFSVHDGLDNGTIIDFVQKRTGATLEQIRKELRQWIGQYAPIQQKASKPEKSTTEVRQVITAWVNAAIGKASDYLRGCGITAQILADSRFSFRIDTSGNHYFPHHDGTGLVGLEIQNREISGFSEGGKRSLFYTSNLATARCIYFCGSAVECMSLAQIVNDPEAAFVSIGGTLSPIQKDFIQDIVRQTIERQAELVLAFENDEVGQRFTDETRVLIGRDLPSIVPRTKSWNEDLQNQQPTEPRTGKQTQHPKFS